MHCAYSAVPCRRQPYSADVLSKKVFAVLFVADDHMKCISQPNVEGKFAATHRQRRSTKPPTSLPPFTSMPLNILSPMYTGIRIPDAAARQRCVSIRADECKTCSHLVSDQCCLRPESAASRCILRRAEYETLRGRNASDWPIVPFFAALVDRIGWIAHCDCLFFTGRS